MDFFLELSFILVVTMFVALVMQWLRQPLILGHILSGIILGPIVLNLIQSQETLAIFSQIGIAILLFIVGLNLQPSVIREVGKVALVTGIGQVVFTSLIGALIGFVLGFSAIVSLYLGVDFAYAIHTEIGNTCTGAKVNDSNAPLDTILKNGDMVEIMIDKSRKGPNPAWIKFVKTRHARQKVRQQARSRIGQWIKGILPGDR